MRKHELEELISEIQKMAAMIDCVFIPDAEKMKDFAGRRDEKKHAALEPNPPA
jgi:hypothetical protein